MITSSQNLTLYHAGSEVIEHPDLGVCRKQNDFGQGFYLTTSREQADRFVRTAIRKRGQNLGFGYVNEYVLQGFDGIETLEFASADERWLRCICAYRRSDIAPEDTARWDMYDAIVGKVANDDTMTTLSIYLLGGYGAYGSSEAVALAVGQLKPQRLHDQVCLKSQAAIGRLVWVTSHKVVPS
ncbi:MAG: DUF3990 domain-containing protein [Coriobacteriales bacterium]|jgi:hypothetical protein|nr:DUF3990 domain-containing protein [Coriobacteriales bacterium]